MSRVARVLALLACAACVPASEKAPPRGALGFVTEPSPASRGEPFVTSDGWVVRIDQLVLEVSVSASTTDDRAQLRSYASETYRFDATRSVEVFVRAIPAGAAKATLSLSGSYLGGPSGYESAARFDEDTNVLGLTAGISARFLAPADVHRDYGDWHSASGPAMLLGLRAERAGRVVTMDLTLDLYSQSTEGTADVRADALVTVPTRVVAEALFLDERSHDLRFDDFAAADADGDGVVTGPELSTAPATPSAWVPSGVFHLVDVVRERGGNIFAAQ